MKVLFLNNNGAGFADFVEVAEGTTVEQFFGQWPESPWQQGSTTGPSALRAPASRAAIGAILTGCRSMVCPDLWLPWSQQADVAVPD